MDKPMSLEGARIISDASRSMDVLVLITGQIENIKKNVKSNPDPIRDELIKVVDMLMQSNAMAQSVIIEVVKGYEGVSDT